MIYLIDYDWKLGRLISMRCYAEAHRAAAQDARLKLELDLLAGQQEREVVLLQAGDEAALRRTHQRYFLGADAALAPAH
jgi:hypothetical protein